LFLWASRITVNLSLFYVSHTTVHFVGLSVNMVSWDSIGDIETKLRPGSSGVRITAVVRFLYLKKIVQISSEAYLVFYLMSCIGRRLVNSDYVDPVFHVSLRPILILPNIYA